MVKKGTLASIDVGSTKICTILANIGDAGAFRILGVGVAPSSGLRRGLVANLDEAKESIRESVKRAERASGMKVDSAYVGVTGRHISSVNNRGVVAIAKNDRLVSPHDLKRVLESARSVSVPSDRQLLHVIPRQYILDGHVGVQNPVGMHGFRLDVETHIITAAVASVQNLVKCVRGTGVEIEDLILEPIASSEAVLATDEMNSGVILADIGGGTTDIAVFRNGSIWHTSVLPIGGYQVTRDISIGLGVPFDVAEEMKKKYGKAMAIQNGATDISSTSEQNGHSIATRDICNIIRARMEEILRLVLLELPSSDYETLVPSGLVLTGGTSNLPGIESLGQEILQMPVRVGIPKGMYGIADTLYDPAYATSVGLLLWGAKHEVGEGLPPLPMKRRIAQAFSHFFFQVKKNLF
jgi:cell division protein FtsA